MMFKMTRPCDNCPFRKGKGCSFKLGKQRIQDIVDGPSFQCHKTLDYENFDDPIARQGAHPQQCAGLMSLLSREGKPNQIMQIGERLGYFDPAKLDHATVYESINAAMEEHA